MNGDDGEGNNNGNEGDDNIKVITPKYKHSYREECWWMRTDLKDWYKPFKL